ncbi:hypothetical protein F4804DRAFT_218659 [Jackrogersella minutella]|nr:hypothetical protein F4804DRAFT_218659 [Jackrogersella minutella]
MDEANRVPFQPITLAIYIISIIFTITSTVVVCLRVYIRWIEKSIWWDDGMMFGGLMIYIINITIGCRAAYFGVGTHTWTLTEAQQKEAKIYLTIWMPVYSICLVLVKGSICMTMLRLTETMQYIRIAVYVLLGFSIVSSITSFVGSMAICQPFAANWDSDMVAEGRGGCASVNIVLTISYVTTAITIGTDIACAMLPAIILWNTQLKLKVKLLVGLLLSFGSFASVCTIIRTPYIKYYNGNDIIYWSARFILWSNIENAIGLIAGSVPVLQRLIVRRLKKKGSAATPNTPGLVTFGSAPVRFRSKRVFSNPTDIGFSVATVHSTHHPGDWQRLADDSSSQCIRADYTYEVELSPASESRSREGEK